MALFRFIKVPRHRQYEYQPRYWNPEKEKLEERIRNRQEAKEGGVEGMRNRVRTGFRQRTFSQDQSYRKRETFRSNIRLLIVAVALLLITYTFLTRYLPELIQLMEAR
jgi:hypothetical protein